MTKYCIRNLVQCVLNYTGLVTNKPYTQLERERLSELAKQEQDTRIKAVISAMDKLETLSRERITDYLWKEEKNNGRYTTKTS